MNILALETSGDFCSVALWRGGEIHEREILAGQRQSGLLLDLVHDVLHACSATLHAVDGIAFGAGPGSFTGLRVACGVAQGLAFGADKPVVGVGTLQAMAEAAGSPRVTCCVDARMSEVYQAAYEKIDGAWCAVQEPGVYAPDAVPLLPGDGWLACGSGFGAYRDKLSARYGAALTCIDEALHARARDVAILAAPVFARGGGMPATCAAPHYVRDKVALMTHER
ncbi:MAG: tRNA (adenosine(37)-N6)-threonylcarbamoyltransferase complex dimerization subunit type 1 TsaB [Betaproteobacteria bacterium]|nr:tRNA (adenosine(37)-N6)-threonylcarbamoyltransferase complex dimerization subunit type 1 TsaB [Betaproteobacteria bacterium]